MTRHTSRRRTFLFLTPLISSLGCGNAVSTSPEATSRTEQALLDGADARFQDIGLSCAILPSSEDAQSVHLALTNDGPHDISVHTWGTPWDQNSSGWSVVREGNEQRYLGITALGRRPSKADYVTIKPGETLQLDDSPNRRYALAGNGPTTVALKNPILSALVDGVPLAVQHDCDSLELDLAEPSSTQFDNVTEPLIYVGGSDQCSSTEQAITETAEVVSRASVILASKFATTGTPIFTRWFGNATTAQATYVRDQVVKINDKWSTFKGSCDGSQGTCANANAWVQGGDQIHLCDGFFSISGFSVYDWSSRSGTLAHEKMHLVSSQGDQSHSVCTDGGDTSCYGAPDAMALAVASPTKAVINAENYEHFVSEVYMAAVLAPNILSATLL